MFTMAITLCGSNWLMLIVRLTVCDLRAVNAVQLRAGKAGSMCAWDIEFLLLVMMRWIGWEGRKY